MRDNIESYYTLVPNAVGDEYHIELKGTEKFDGVVYDIVTVPKDIADQDLDESDRAELENLVGDILLNILESDLSDKEQHKDGIVKIGTDNPQVTH
jgi:hypothetical protein